MKLINFKWKSYTLKEKFDVLNDFNDGMICRDVGKKHNLHQKHDHDMEMEGKSIYDKYTEDKKNKLFRKCWRSEKHKTLFTRLFDKFCEARE